jgi:uncharacterized membrane protein
MSIQMFLSSEAHYQLIPLPSFATLFSFPTEQMSIQMFLSSEARYQLIPLPSFATLFSFPTE